MANKNSNDFKRHRLIISHRSSAISQPIGAAPVGAERFGPFTQAEVDDDHPLATETLRRRANGGPEPRSPFSPAMSFFIHCPTQREVDALWERLGEGGERLQCGWLRDKFGVTWQVMPTALGEMLSDENRARAARVMRAMTRMCKLDMAQLQRVYEGEGA